MGIQLFNYQEHQISLNLVTSGVLVAAEMWAAGVSEMLVNFCHTTFVKIFWGWQPHQWFKYTSVLKTNSFSGIRIQSKQILLNFVALKAAIAISTRLQGVTSQKTVFFVEPFFLTLLRFFILKCYFYILCCKLLAAGFIENIFYIEGHATSFLEVIAVEIHSVLM